MKFRYYSLIELIAAIGVLMVLMSCFFLSISSLNEMKKTFVRENRALLVIDNTVERLSQRKSYDKAKIKEIFTEEYEKSCLHEEPLVGYELQENKNSLTINITGKKKRSLIEVTLKCLKAKK